MTKFAPLSMTPTKIIDAGKLVNLADFACVQWWEGAAPDGLSVHEILPDVDGCLAPVRAADGLWHLGLEWEEPRDIARVAIAYMGAVPPDVYIQYWQNNWPTPAPERRPGARRGWIGRDDPWHGRWVTVRAQCLVENQTCTFIFDPVDIPELRGVRTWEALEEAEDYLAPFRRTLKLRILSGGTDQPTIRAIEATGRSRWREGLIDIRMPSSEVTAAEWGIVADATNGHILTLETLTQGTARVRVLYVGADAARADRTIVTVHSAERPFSFLISDLEEGPIAIPDLGVAITWASQPIPREHFQAQRAATARTIYDRVANEPEQSLERAMAEIPPLDVIKQDSGAGMGRYLPIGFDGGRQEFAVRHNGELFADKAQLKLSGRDAANLLWPGRQLRYRIGSGDPPDFREEGHATQQELLEGWLPVVISRWLDREIAFEVTTLATLVDGPPREAALRRGDEDLAAMMQVVIRNTTHGRKRAQLWLAIAPAESLALEGDSLFAEGRVVPDVQVARQWRVDAYPTPRLRGLLMTGQRGILQTVPLGGRPEASHVIPTALLYSLDLEGGEAHTLTAVIPFAIPANASRLRGLDFAQALSELSAYWRGFVAGGQLQVPEQVLADFHKAARVHVGISTDKDPVNGLTIVPAATWSYGACGNEACWQITMLDQAGHHARAAEYLETFLQTQGVSRPDGRFASSEGALVAMDFDGGKPVMGGFAYNLDQGFIMECLADHYRLSGDRDWLTRVAPALIKACGFVSRERARTKQFDANGDPSEAWGLLPVGHLEDNPEWRHWFAVNAHAYAGLRAIADVLPEINHPAADDLQHEAEAYRSDIRTAALRAMALTPVVRLLDGTYVPHIPTRTGLRGREPGWFREAAYGALHLMEGGVFDPDEPEMTWLLKDLEDNLFVTREWGRPVDLDERWFSHGGVTIQPNLMDLAIDYLRRGEVKHALRALFNNFGASLYADVRTFTEHPVTALGQGVGPFYKSSDESKALTWLRHMLLHEEKGTLHVTQGAPEAWFTAEQPFGVEAMATYFGAVSFEIRPSVLRTTVTLRRDPNHTRARLLSSIALHLHHPAQTAVTALRVNDVPLPIPRDDNVILVPSPPYELHVRVEYGEARPLSNQEHSRA